MKIKSVQENEDKSIWHLFASFLIVFFLIVTLLTALVLLPRINDVFEKQHVRDTQATLEIEMEILKRFVDNHRIILEDLAAFPVVANSVLMSAGSDPNLIDLIDNFSIAGERSRIVLQDIAGGIIYQTTQKLRGDFSAKAPWVNSILEGTLPYNFQLIGQEENSFRFVISIPVKYRGNIEGILSAEISAPLQSIFSKKTMGGGGAFKIQQGDIVVQMDTSKIKIPREISRVIERKNIKLTYVIDDSRLLAEQNKLRNLILIVLLVGLSVSFLLFIIVAIRSFKDKDEKSLSNNTSFIRSYAAPLTVGIIGVSIAIVGALLLNNLQQQTQLQKKLSNSKAQILRIDKQLNSKLQILSALKAFYDGSNFVDRQEFNFFSQALLQDSQSIQALEWVPRISHAQRENFRQLAIKDGFKNYRIIEPNIKTGEIEIAPKRNIYHPVFYVEPYEGNERALGIDSPNNAGRARAIYQAERTGQPAASNAFKLVQEIGEQLGVLIFNPVYKKNETKDGFDERRIINGFVLLVLRIEDMIDDALRDFEGKQEILIQDITDIQKPEIIYQSMDQIALEKEEKYSQILDVAGRQWKVIIFPNFDRSLSNTSFLPWAILFAGITFSCFATYTFIQLVRRRHIVEGLVKIRTEEIEKTTKELELANTELEEFSYRTSHDLRSPLISSIALLDIARTSLKSKNYENTGQSIDHALSSLSKLTTLIDDILQLTLVQKKSEEKQEICFSTMLHETHDKFAHMEGYDQIRFKENLNFEKTLFVQKLRLSMVLENLLSNSIKYRDAEKEESFIEISTFEKDNKFVLQVEDNGLGIPENQQHNLFKMFKRFHPKAAYGSGLGMHLMKKSADVLGGELEYEDTGQGSIFRLIIAIEE